MSVYVIFGAAVKEGGIPSGSLLRRIETAINASQKDENPFFIGTGGIGKYPPSESMVIESVLLKAGIDQKRIIKEEASKDTLDSILNCSKVLKEHSWESVIVCTDTYHQFRCKLLFGMMGFKVAVANTASSRQKLGTAKWLRYNLKEFVSTHYDALLLLYYILTRH